MGAEWYVIAICYFTRCSAGPPKKTPTVNKAYNGIVIASHNNLKRRLIEHQV